MFEITDELVEYMEKFNNAFDDIVPLSVIPQRFSTEDIIEAIKESLEVNENVLPERLEYKDLLNNKDIIM